MYAWIYPDSIQNTCCIEVTVYVHVNPPQCLHMLLLNTGKGVKPFALWTFPGGRSCGDTVDTG